MAKRRITKASKKRLIVFGTGSLIAILFFAFSLIYNIYIIFDLSKEKKELENLYIELQEKAESLKIDIEKFNDEKYLADYAREHYLYSKDGEYIIQMDDIEKTDEYISKEINKNYIILALSVFMIFIFIYIILKGNKKSKSIKKSKKK